MASGILTGAFGAPSNVTNPADREREARKVARLGLSPRQQELNRYYSYFQVAQHDMCKVDWDGSPRVTPLEREAMAAQGFVTGTYESSPQGSGLALKFRRPTAPYGLGRVIVKRFTGVLFGERHPSLTVAGDPATEDYATGLAEAERLWANMSYARDLGGAMGSVAVGFQFLDGRPCLEVHDARWLTPSFLPGPDHVLASIEQRYQFPKVRRDPRTGLWVEENYWYRRTIDQESDVVYEEEPVGDGEEPNWREARRVDHGWEFCPVVWTPNSPCGPGEHDGEPDCCGIWDTIDAIDALVAQANRGTIANADPTLHVASDLKQEEILRKGSGNAIHTEAAGDVGYIEIAGTGPQACRELAKELRGQALEVARCVLEHPDFQNRTAEEVRKAYSSMTDAVAVLKEQYGRCLVVPLVDMQVRAAREATRVKVAVGGGLVRGKVVLPPRVDGDRLVERVLGTVDGAQVGLKWPDDNPPTLADVSQAVSAAASAKDSGLVDLRHAVEFVAPYMKVEDPGALVTVLEEQKEEALAAFAGTGEGPPPFGGKGKGDEEEDEEEDDDDGEGQDEDKMAEHAAAALKRIRGGK